MPKGERQGFLEMLQALEPAKKTKVLIISTAIIMLVIIYFWLAYFNNILTTASQPVAQDAGSAAAGQSWFSYMYGQAVNAAKGMARILQSPRQYLIKGQ